MAKESRLAEIYRQELKKGGLFGALISASGERFKEKTDIRNMLPKSGISGAAFEKMFGKSYKYGSSSKGSSGGEVSNSSNEKITRIGADTKITAKNSMSLPVIASQMNIMQKNIAKLVKINGGTPSTKADSFFSNSKFRENAYESKFTKNGGAASPTPVGGKKEDAGGFFSSLLGGIGSLLSGTGALAVSLVSSLGGFFKGLFGLILASGIFGYFLKDPETRKTVKDFLVTVLTNFFENIKETFNLMKETLQDPAVVKAFQESIKAIFDVLVEGFKILWNTKLGEIETPFGKLDVTIGRVIEAFVGFKAAMFLLETAILLRAKNIGAGVPDMPDIPDPDRKNPNKGGGTGTDKNGRKLPPRDPKTGRFMKRAPAGAGGVKGGLKGFKGLGPLGLIAGALFLDSLFANDEMADATYSILENSPFFDKITDDEMEKFIGLIENKKYDSANAYHQELAKKNGYDAKKKGWGLYGFDYEKSKTPVAVPSASASAVDPNVAKASSESNTSPSKSTDKFNFTKYKELVATRESGGSYQGDNKIGFIGKYQFGAQALETYGYLKAGTSKDRMAVYSPSNWTGKGGIKSAEDFKKDTGLQENLMMKLTDDNMKTLASMGVITGKETGAELASKLYAAHHGGAGNAAKFFKEGKDTADFAFKNSSVAKSASLMAESYDKGSIQSAPWSGSGTVVASSSITPSSLANSTADTILASLSGSTAASSPKEQMPIINTGNALIDLFANYLNTQQEVAAAPSIAQIIGNSPAVKASSGGGNSGGELQQTYNKDLMKYLINYNLT